MFRLMGMAAVLYVSTFSIALPSAQSPPDGRAIFRFDTFGSEQLWTDALRMQQVISQAVSPKTALSVGLKVDVDALPPTIIDALRTGQVDLDDPAVTVQLLKLNAVVGIIGKVVGANDNLATVGITCALCHSTVDDSFAPGIGKRLDGWANTTLNPGAIIALSPAITDKAYYRSWGPGKYDPRFRIFDGVNVIQITDPMADPPTPVVIPPVYGLRGVGFETFNADGAISYWNRYVAVTQMGGQGSFTDPRIDVNVIQTPDLVEPKLPALLDYQLSLLKPPPPNGSFNTNAARRGANVFAAGCATCHEPPLFTDVLSGPDPSVPLLHDPDDIPTDPGYAARSATKQWRTTPLRALWQHPPYFHDGSAATLLDVVNRYDNDPQFSLGLTRRQKEDLVEFLKSL